MRKIKRLKALIELALLNKQILLQLIREQEHTIQRQSLTIKSLNQQINRGEK